MVFTITTWVTGTLSVSFTGSLHYYCWEFNPTLYYSWKLRHRGEKKTSKKIPKLGGRNPTYLYAWCYFHTTEFSEPQSSPARAEKQLSLARRLITTGRWDKPVEQLKCQQKVTQPENHGTSGLPRTTWNNCHDGSLKEQPLGAAQELCLTWLQGRQNGNQRETGTSRCPEERDSWHLIIHSAEKYSWRKTLSGNRSSW